MSTTYVGYVDDSGDETMSLHSAVLVPVAHWSSHLTKWKRYRHNLRKKHDVPPEFELHASHWLEGKDRPSLDPGAAINTTKGIRREWATKALLGIAAMPDLKVFTAVTKTNVKSEAYADFLLRLDESLAAYDGYTMIVVDGDPKNADQSIHRAHRTLALGTRRIIEDGFVQNAAASQFIQMADLVVHSAFQHLAGNPDRSYMWDWYPRYLHANELGAAGCVCQQR